MRAARTAASLTATVLLGLAAGGCSIKNDNPDLVSGKKLFVQKCGSCHVLNRAGTKGTIGPNLDAAFARSKVDGLGYDAIEGVVRSQIGSPSMPGSQGTGVMPANLVHGAQATDVAAYVASVAAEKGKDKGVLATAAGGGQSKKPAVEKNGVLTIPADPTGQLLFANKTAQAKAGSVSVEMPNMSGTDHNLDIQGVGKGPIIKKGVSKFQANLKPGKYTFLCDVPGHAAAGMKGTLTVK